MTDSKEREELREQIGEITFVPYGSNRLTDIANEVSVLAMDKIMQLIDTYAKTLETRARIDECYQATIGIAGQSLPYGTDVTIAVQEICKGYRDKRLAQLNTSKGGEDE